MKHQHTLTRGPRYAGTGDHEFYANADNGPRISTYFLSDEDWQAMGFPDAVVLTVEPKDSAVYVPLAERLAQVEHMHDDAERRVDELNAEVARLRDQGSR